MRCLVSEEDIIDLRGDPGGCYIQVYLLKSVDRFQTAFCFVSSAHDTEKCVLQYTTRSGRGPVACFIPDIVDGALKWETQGVISSTKQFKTSDWCESNYCMDISRDQFQNYQRWLLKWIKKNKVYSVFEGDSTIRKFLNESFTFFNKTLAERVQLHKPLFLPEIVTYTLSYDAKEKQGSLNLNDIVKWYQTYKLAVTYDTLHNAVETINKSEHIYLRDVSGSESKYWLIECPKLQVLRQKLTFSTSTANDNSSSSSPEESVVISRTFTRRSRIEEAKESSSSNTVYLLDEDEEDDSSKSDNAVSAQPQFKPRRRKLSSYQEVEEDYSYRDDVHHKAKIKRKFAEKYRPFYSSNDKLKHMGVYTTATPVQPGAITQVGVGAINNTLPPGNAIDIVIVLVTLLIVFFIIFVVIYFYYAQAPVYPVYPVYPNYPEYPPGYPMPEVYA